MGRLVVVAAPVTEHRATVRHEHARIGRKIINFDSGGYGVCSWDTCDADASSLFEVRTHEHARSVGCDSALARHVTYAFCREKCKQYWLACTGAAAADTAARNGGRIAGMLPPGYRQGIT